jgi:hypothetical protein
VSRHADPYRCDCIQNSATVPQSISKSLAYALIVPSSTLNDGGVGVGVGISVGVGTGEGSGVGVGAG